jgi:hypothetical protein
MVRKLHGGSAFIYPPFTFLITPHPDSLAVKVISKA